MQKRDQGSPRDIADRQRNIEQLVPEIPAGRSAWSRLRSSPFQEMQSTKSGSTAEQFR